MHRCIYLQWCDSESSLLLSCDFNLSHQLVVAAADSGHYHVWDVRSGEKVTTVKGIYLFFYSYVVIALYIGEHCAEKDENYIHRNQHLKMSIGWLSQSVSVSIYTLAELVHVQCKFCWYKASEEEWEATNREKWLWLWPTGDLVLSHCIH